MCQLLGMSCNTPTDFCFSFTGFAERAGRTDVHKDGWGIAFYEGKGLRCFLDVLPACDSPVAALVKAYPIKTLAMVAHIRYATQGPRALENVHPFTRELWGRYWTFAHNGDLPPAALDTIRAAAKVPYRPVGDTDSEACFCFLLNRLEAAFPDGVRPPLASLYGVLRAVFQDLIVFPGTICNFLLSDGDHVIVGCCPGSRPGSTVFNGLYYIVRQHPFTTARLADCDCAVDFATVTTLQDRVAIIATQPLTVNEEWVQMGKGDLFVFHNGRPLRSLEDVTAAAAEPPTAPATTTHHHDPLPAAAAAASG
jgi:predicted glutamine amidotransferase